MEPGRILIAGAAFSIAAAGAAGDTLFVRPGPCAAPQTYFLAANSAAIIRVEGAQSTDGVIVYRRQPDRGWASKRLLRRFDLRLDETGTTIVNSGKFCRGPQ